MNSSNEEIIDDSEPIYDFVPLKKFPGYSISNPIVKLRNDKTGRILEGSKNKQGYQQFTISINEKNRTYGLQVILAIEFLGYDPLNRNGMEVDHIDRNIANNSIENLRIVSHSENNKNKDRMKRNPNRFIKELPAGEKRKLISIHNIIILDEYYMIEGEVYKKINDHKFLWMRKSYNNIIQIKIGGRNYTFSLNSKHLVTALCASEHSSPELIEQK
jgi:hypothetical protein